MYLKLVGKMSFQNLDNLQIVDLSYNKLDGLQFGQVKVFLVQQLKDITNNKCIGIEKGAFQNSPVGEWKRVKIDLCSENNKRQRERI